MAKASTKASSAGGSFGVKGTHGFVVNSGYLQSQDTSNALQGSQKWKTYDQLVANVSIVAASLRAFLNLVGRTEWTIEPAKDLDEGESSDDAKQVAELVENAIFNMDTSWTKVSQRAATFRFLGFHFAEWQAKRNDDGTIGFENMHFRPCHTIERWDVDDYGKLNGIWQRSPMTGRELYIPKAKLLYLVDDILTDSPDGLGLLRHCVPSNNRLKEYYRNEALGFTRDMRGIPIGRAPLTALNAAVENGDISESERDKMLEGLEEIVQMQAKSEDTGLILDSQPYTGQTADGRTIASNLQWGLDLVQGSPSGLTEIDSAIDRTNREMARILGTEQLMLGEGAGSHALSEDKTDAFHMQLEGTLADLSEGVQKDVFHPLTVLNGIPDHLKPTMGYEAVQRRDVAAMAATLRDMASAGAVMAPDDPAIDEIRMLMGLSAQPDSVLDLTLDQTSLGNPDPLPGEEDE